MNASPLPSGILGMGESERQGVQAPHRGPPPGPPPASEARSGRRSAVPSATDRSGSRAGTSGPSGRPPASGGTPTLSFVAEDAYRILDVNIRQHYYSKEIIVFSLRNCNVFKINDEELLLMKRIFDIEGKKEVDACRWFVETFNLKKSGPRVYFFPVTKWGDPF